MKFFSTVGIVGALGLSMLTVGHGLAVSRAETRSMAAVNDVQPFAGKWTAMHDGIRIVELALRVEKETIEWSLPKTLGRAEHAPGCLVERSTHFAELVRSLSRRKKPLFIDRTKSRDPAGTTHFQLNSGKKAEEEELLEAGAASATEACEERMRSPL